ncbi:putative leader peptide [Actinomadura litoris]|nr:putative leader peptide [Actinomadura litoris]
MWFTLGVVTFTSLHERLHVDLRRQASALCPHPFR